MIPATISRKLSALRFWEALLRALWGVARVIAVVLVILGMACLIDWLIDRQLETPWGLRLALLLGQVAVAGTIIYLWLVRPLVGRMTATDMALLVEEKIPVFGHRLISVVQFHQPNAQTAGMSSELISRVTEETVVRTSRTSFAPALDKRRVGWSAATLLPVLALAAVPLLLWPELVNILLQRQLLADVEIPRSVYLASDNPTVWPKGEDLVLRFRVKGSGWSPESVGLVRVHPEGQPSMDFELEYESTSGEEAVFVSPPKAKRDAVKLPTLAHVTYRAWLEDGRTPHACDLRFEPRPVIDPQQIQAWVLLPEYCPVTPSGKPYEIAQSRGEIVALEGSRARVAIRVQKPITKGTLQVLGPTGLETNPLVLTGMIGLAPSPLVSLSLAQVLAQDKIVQQQLLGTEVVLAEHSMTIRDDGDAADVVFPLPATAVGYRLIVADEYGFKNIPAPRRGIHLVTEEPPQVAMLPTLFDVGLSFGAAEDFPMDGLPIPPKGKIRVAYTCSHPFGLGEVVLHYRVLKLKSGADDGSGDAEPTPWYRLPLIETKASKDAGPFLPDRGIFKNSKDDEQIQFHAVPSNYPELILGKKVGGGRFDFHTTNMLVDKDGKAIPLQKGDQVEYKLEVNPGWNPKYKKTYADEFLRKTGFSETRVVNVVSEKEWLERLIQYDQETAKLRQLKNEQGKVFPK